MSSAVPAPLVLLGPQSKPTLREAVEETAGRVPVATITAGWQEREAEDGELDAHLGGETFNLRLYARAERALAEDPELGDAHRRLQEALRLLRRAYNLRLAHLMDAWVELLELQGDAGVLLPEREAALEAIRRLDAAHLRRVRQLRETYERRWAPLRRPAVVRARREIAAELEGAGAVVIAGGHVAALLARLRLFELRDLLAGKPLVAWSAGAMALGSRVVLFHDSPPQGPGHAEAFDEGLGCFDDVVPLPHGSARLRLDDARRTARFARRFAPAWCVLLDEGDRLDRVGGAWRAPHGGRRLSPLGGTQEVAP